MNLAGSAEGAPHSFGVKKLAQASTIAVGSVPETFDGELCAPQELLPSRIVGAPAPVFISLAEHRTVVT
jgi:hypothetical protein